MQRWSSHAKDAAAVVMVSKHSCLDAFRLELRADYRLRYSPHPQTRSICTPATAGRSQPIAPLLLRIARLQPITSANSFPYKRAIAATAKMPVAYGPLDPPLGGARGTRRPYRPAISACVEDEFPRWPRRELRQLASYGTRFSGSEPSSRRDLRGGRDGGRHPNLALTAFAPTLAKKRLTSEKSPAH